MMKKIFTVICCLWIVSSCTELDLEPPIAELGSQVFKSASDYRSYLAKIYASMSLTGQDGPAGKGDLTIIEDEGFTSYIRAYWKAQELTTDEAVIAWTDAGIRDLHLHTWSSQNQFIRVLYYRIFYMVALVNDFLEQSSVENLDVRNISAGERPEIMEYRVEARFLRALAYWHALDLFRNVPIYTSITSNIPGASSPTETFNFIESELNAIEASMIAARDNEYGRADRAALWMLQAKLYLNAEVYIEENRYTDCITACRKVIDAGYSLNNNYATLFMADNHTSDEIIFSLPADGLRSQSWGSTTFLVHAPLANISVNETTGDTIVFINPLDYGVSDGWAGLRTTSAMVDKFRIGVGNTFDPRVNFFTKGQNLEINDIGEFTDGYAVIKYVNTTSTGEVGSDLTHVDTDYVMFRLADAYLMYAESILRGGTGGDINQALTFINSLRQRAYGDNSANILASDMTLDFVLDERSKELYWEGSRRIDLIRYGRFSDQGIWPWKGGTAEGKTTESFRDIFPIPASDLVANPNLIQNPGY